MKVRVPDYDTRITRNKFGFFCPAPRAATADRPAYSARPYACPFWDSTYAPCLLVEVDEPKAYVLPAIFGK
jgi:hypothetical protein